MDTFEIISGSTFQLKRRQALSATLANCHSLGAQEQACAAFRNLSAQPGNRDKIFAAKGHDQVVAAMLRNPEVRPQSCSKLQTARSRLYEQLR